MWPQTSLPTWMGLDRIMVFFAGFSHNSIMLSACRALQGIGLALLVPNAMALVGRTFPMGMKRNIVSSLFRAAGPTGFVLGAVLSSICAQLGCE